VLSEGNVSHRLHWLVEQSRVFTVCYFGRLVWKKGVDYMLESIMLSRRKGCNVKMIIIGDGDMLDSVQGKIIDCDLSSAVSIRPLVPYGEELFKILKEVHVALAAPLVEDTPRSAFDALARGVPIIAFDTEYFADLARKTKGVKTVKWLSATDMAAEIILLSQNRAHLAEMAHDGLRFAASNTQDEWLKRRVEWTQKFMLR
jgi:glycosyltransferase involved in cell wall biosynthesis